MWKSFIPPKLFFILWRILHSRLPTNDVLQSRGMLLWFPQAPYVLLPLMQNRRTTYLFVVRLLLVFGDGLVLCFGCRLPPLDMVQDLWHFINCCSFNPQLFHWWLLAAYHHLYSLWKTWNKLPFEDVFPSLNSIRLEVIAHIRYYAKICPGFCSFWI
ncbi:Ribonuclease H [Melia azedarach]|uniref:Ribonuclease H n=1 Tax=Melia azedarach TaxID=155640 RepID=A0ACC1XSW9_MELAZ|nr:Ribonuclease H [Melia azedarach]